MRTVEFTVTEEDAACKRLDKVVLGKLHGTTRALLSDAFADGRVFQNGRRAGKSDVPRLGAVVRAERIPEQSDRAVKPEPGIPLEVVYSDADVCAIDKPAGQACHPIAIGEMGTLAAALLARFPAVAGIGDNPRMPGLLHRLDSGTSGLVLAACSQTAYRAIREQFTKHTARKIYLARVQGKVSKEGGISGYLAHSSSFRGRMRPVDASGSRPGNPALFAETFYQPIPSDTTAYPGTTLLKVTIYTGVTHQIRCQLASIGHPIVGDCTYGGPGWQAPGHALHAYSIRFIHPGSKQALTLHTLRLPAWAGTDLAGLQS
ncbi:MAG: RluA family pseudouridine synthase [Kiritimatiellia bacterium]